MRVPDVVMVAAAVAACAALGGCAAPGGGAASNDALLARQASLAEEVKVLQEEFRALRASREEFEHRYSDEGFARPLREGAERIGGRLDALERRIGALETAVAAERTAADRRLQAVIEEVSAENARLRGAIEGLRTGAEGGEYTVRPGDTLAGIAQRLGVPSREIMRTNEITDPDMLRAGRKLKIPAPAR